jgi:hypothetical protein
VRRPADESEEAMQAITPVSQHSDNNVINHRTAGTTEPPLRRENHRIPEAI